MNIKKEILEEYLNTKEGNIIVDNIINDYLIHYRKNVNLKLINKYKDDKNKMYKIFLDLLEVDEYDEEFSYFENNYNLRNIKKIDVNEVVSNPYYITFNCDINIKKNGYELSFDSYLPYELFLYDDIKVYENEYYKEINYLGYFDKNVKFLALKKDNVAWMSITPHEIFTMKDDIDKVSGNVLVLGLGLGYFLYMISLKDNVNKITVIEKDKNIINLFKSFLFPKFNKNKIQIIEDDAISYLENNKEEYDYVYCDLYHNQFDALPLYIKIKNIEKNYKNTTFLYWIETSIIALIRRCTLSLLEEQYDNLKEENYLKAENNIDKLINALYFKTKDIEINNDIQLKEFLSNENILNLIKDIKL